MNELIEVWKRRCKLQRRIIEMIDAGDLRSGERTAQCPVWTDTTHRSRARAAAQLSQLEELIARYAWPTAA